MHRDTYGVWITESLDGLQDEAFVFTKDVDILDPTLQPLTGKEEEGLLSLHQLLLAKLRLAVRTTGVKDYTVVAVGQGGDVDHTHYLNEAIDGVK